jgi:myo-inositol-1(or 4)-monophosphatase
VGAAASARVLVNDAQGPRGGEHEAAGGEADVNAREAEVREADALLAVAVEAATTAGAMLAERVRHGVEGHVSSKSTPTDLVSEADLASERAIRELLARRRPDDGFLGEEGARAEGSSGLSWVVDPLDGTVNFLFGIPQWCVSVAVRDSAGTLAGAVYDPNRDELFTATRHGRPTLVGPRETVELSGSRDLGRLAGGVHDGYLATAMVATGFAYDADVRAAQARVLARVVPRVRDVRRFGSAALDLTWTATGRYDAYFERTVKPWDIAAGALICERAGLVVLELPVHESLPWGILVTRPGLAEAMLELVGGT